MYIPRAPAGEIDVLVEVKTGDVVLVPYGYHGPTMAARARPYFLNVLAGPGKGAHDGVCDDPAHAWVRASWLNQDVNPRLPMTSHRNHAIRLPVAQALVRFLLCRRLTRPRAPPLLRRLPGYIRPWQCRRPGPGAARSWRMPCPLPRPQRAGDGSYRRRFLAHVRPATRLCLHHLDRSGHDELVPAPRSPPSGIPVLLLPW